MSTQSFPRKVATLSTKRISVIIIVRNGARTLQECLDTVFHQSLPASEVIVVDNNSTDATKAIIMGAVATYETCRYAFEPYPSRGAARNKGLELATGDILVMTDADCIVPHTWLADITHLIRNRTERVIVGSQYDILESYTTRHTQKMYEHTLKRSVSTDGHALFLDTKNCAFDAQLLKQNRFDRRFKAVEDAELMFRLRQYTHIKYLPTLKVGHKHPQSFRRLAKVAYERAFWNAQIYHKFKNKFDIHGQMSFLEVPWWRIIGGLCYFEIEAIRSNGWSHLPYFLVYDLSWKYGSVRGFFKKSL
jgi:glycosyltransferase involved in cell wall biosynthesis